MGKKLKYEVGNIYRNNGCYYIAVGHQELLSLKNGEVVHRKPYTQYDYVRTMTVEQLCQEWGINLDTLDRLMAPHVMPKTNKTRPPGNRRRSLKMATDEYYQLRLARVLAK